MRYTLFNSPRWHRLLAPLASWLLRRWGWRLVGEVPRTRRFVVIAAPHTSNWDFLLMLLAVFETGLDLHWMGKHSLFRRPFGGLMRWLGGIPIDRSRAATRWLPWWRSSGSAMS
jgi:1-acyl-sn-glycerol-3-phosphate acyltransferase